MDCNNTKGRKKMSIEIIDKWLSDKAIKLTMGHRRRRQKKAYSAGKRPFNRFSPAPRRVFKRITSCKETGGGQIGRINRIKRWRTETGRGELIG
jgi:hypothetical protein